MTSQSKGKNARRRERLFASGVHVPRATHPNSKTKRRRREATATTAAADVAATTAESAEAETMLAFNTEQENSSNDASNDKIEAENRSPRTTTAVDARYSTQASQEDRDIAGEEQLLISTSAVIDQAKPGVFEAESSKFKEASTAYTEGAGSSATKGGASADGCNSE